MKQYKMWQIAIVSIILGGFLAGCASKITLENTDKSLPPVKNIKTITDVSSVGFEWDAINDARVRGVVVYRGVENEFSEIAYLDNPLTTHFVDEDLSPESSYRYFFHTLSVDKYSERSAIINVKTSFITPVESVYASNDYPKKVKLIWSPHPNPSISHYLIQRDYSGNFKTIAIVNHRLLVEYFDENLEDESAYSYRIIAVDYMGNPSRPSKIVTARTRKKPEMSARISASDNLPRSIVVTWDKVQKAAGYRVYRAKDPNGSFSNIGSAKGERYVDDGLEPNTSFYYKVSSVDSANVESNLTPAARGSTRALPRKPRILKGYVDKNQSQIEWEAQAGAQYYVINRKDGLFNTMRFTTKATSFTDKDMATGKEYTYFVVAVDDAGLESEPSEEVVLSIR